MVRKGKITKIWIFLVQKELFRCNKKYFLNFWKAIIWWKNEKLIKNSRHNLAFNASSLDWLRSTSPMVCSSLVFSGWILFAPSVSATSFTDFISAHCQLWTLLTLSRMCPFRAAHGWAFLRLLPKICRTYPTIMKLGTLILYLQKIQKIYKSRDTSLEFCWHQQFFTENQKLLLYQEIQILIVIWCIIANSFNFF